MGRPSIKVNVWPSSKKGKVLANAKVIIGDAISVYPIRIIEGKGGYYLGMPRVLDREGEYRDVFYPVTGEARHTLTELVLKAYSKDRPLFREFPGDEEFAPEVIVRPYRDNLHDLLGYSTVILNGMFRIENIRIYQGENDRNYVMFPERGYRDEGEVVIRSIFEFKNDWDRKLREEICRKYNQPRTQGWSERIKIARGEKEGKLSYEELMDIRRQIDAERRCSAHNREEKTEAQSEEPDQEEQVQEGQAESQEYIGTGYWEEPAEETYLVL